MEMGFQGTVFDTPIQYGTGRDICITNLSSPSFFPNSPGATSSFNQYHSNQYRWSPNCFDAHGSPRLPISNNSTTKAVPCSLIIFPSLSNSNWSRTRMMSEEENIKQQRHWVIDSGQKCWVSTSSFSIPSPPSFSLLFSIHVSSGCHAACQTSSASASSFPRCSKTSLRLLSLIPEPHLPTSRNSTQLFALA